MPLTDYHLQVRDAVVTVLRGLDLGVAVTPLDDLETGLGGIAVPAIAVACVGPEQTRPEWGTNRQSGKGYSVVVALMSAGVANGGKAPVLDMTAFRRQVTVSFEYKRLAGVAEVGYCEVADAGPLFDRELPAFQRLTTALVVTAVGRFPRA